MLRGYECGELPLGDFLGNHDSYSQNLHQQASRLFSETRPAVEVLLHQWSDERME